MNTFYKRWQQRAALHRRVRRTSPAQAQGLMPALFHKLPDYLYIKDTESRFLLANQALAAALGAESPADMQGKTDFDYYANNLAEAYRQDERQIMQTGCPLHDKIETLTTADGSTQHILTSKLPLFDHKGAIIGIVGIGRDISCLKAVEAEREQLISDLDAFARTVSHDLKMPLSLVYGFAELLQLHHRELSAEEIDAELQHIMNGCTKMTSIIDELLYFARLRHQDQVRTRPVAMSRVVNEALNRLSHDIQAQHVTIHRPEQWPSVYGYAPWIEEVWVNYLSNAIKYGGNPPEIILGAKIDRDQVRFWVHDNGPGIPAEAQAKLFTPFTRLHNSNGNGSHKHGHGLGLSIVQRIIEKLGGTVGVESVPGQGSTFSFSLPLAQEAASVLQTQGNL